MADYNDPRAGTTGLGAGFGSVPRAGGQVVFDAGLRKHMLSIYNYMTSGVLLTGIVALLTFNSGLAVTFASGPLMWIVALSPLAIVFAMSFGANRFSKSTLQIMFWAFAALMGLSLSTIFLRFTGTSIAVTFFATAAAFAGLSLYGYTTSKSLSGFGTFLMLGHDWAPPAATLHSYELFAREVIPHFKGQITAPQASHEWAKGLRDQLFGRVGEAVVKAIGEHVEEGDS